MLERWRQAGLVWPAILTAMLLPVFLGLGTWQWQRKTWKEDLIAKIEARRTAEPVSYIQALSQFVKTEDVDYLRVRITGTFDHGSERHLYDPKPEGLGWDVYTLLEPEGGGIPVFVNRGWVPDALKNPAKRPEGQVSGPQTVVGLVRLDEPRRAFVPDNDVKANRWYVRDTWTMRWGEQTPPEPQQFASSKATAYAPFSIDAEAEPANPGGWPKGGTTELHIRNAHLQYVVTWYAMALTLLGVFAAFARQKLAAVANPPANP